MTESELLNKILECKTCHRKPEQAPDETFHWEQNKLETCICSTCLNNWFVEVAAYYRFREMLEGKNPFERIEKCQE